MLLNTPSAQDGPQQRALAPGSAVPRSRAVASRCRSRGSGSAGPKGLAAGLRGAHGCLSPDPFPTYLCILNDHWPVCKSFQFSHKNPDFQHLTSWQTGLSGAPQQ